MGFSCGIVGLPNVGKSTLFNAITSTAQAQIANYPFCTIDPNKAIVDVPDSRLHTLANIAESNKIIPAPLQVVDIAGLIKDANKGQGLGNKFLENIRSTDVIMQVIRCFEDDDVIHVDNSVNPIRDIEVIETELLLSDISLIEKQITELEKSKNKNPSSSAQIAILKELLDYAQRGNLLSTFKLDDESKKIISKIHLLTMKPIFYVANVSEAGNKDSMFKEVSDFAKSKNLTILPICAKVETEMMEFSSDEKMELINSMGFKETALKSILKHGYDLLDLITFFTIGPKEARAWSIPKGYLAPQAAGKIHTDFEKGFIKADVIGFQDFIDCNGEAIAKSSGKSRLEGKEYVVQDGDIMHFRFNN